MLGAWLGRASGARSHRPLDVPWRPWQRRNSALIYWGAEGHAPARGQAKGQPHVPAEPILGQKPPLRKAERICRAARNRGKFLAQGTLGRGGASLSPAHTLFPGQGAPGCPRVPQGSLGNVLPCAERREAWAMATLTAASFFSGSSLYPYPTPELFSSHAEK